MFKISNRIKETSSTSGTGSVVLGGALGAFQTFSDGIGDGNTTFYTIENNSNWEVGQGTYDSATNSLSRDIVFESSSGGSKISLEGVSTVFCTLPADKVFIQDSDSNVTSVGGVIADSGVFTLVQSSDIIALDDLVVSGDSSIAGSTTLNGYVDAKQEVNTFNLFNSGNIISSGFLTMVRDNSAGNFFHAYKDTTNQTLALHVDENVSPLWKLGLKSTHNSQTEAPSYAYIYARDGSAGVVGNTDNYFSISSSNGFLTHHDTHTILRASSNTGVYIDGHSSAYPTLTVQAAATPATDIQRWENSAGVILSKVDKDGTISGVLNTSGIYFEDGTIQTSAFSASSFLPMASGSKIDQNTSDIVTVSGIAANDTPTFDDLYVKGQIFHDADTNTYIKFAGTDEIQFFAGGKNMLILDEASNDKVVINDDGLNINFRVESNNEENLIFTDGANDKVGIGTSQPQYLLDVSGVGRFVDGVRFIDDTVQTTAGLPSASGSKITQNSQDIVTVSGIAVYASGQAEAGGNALPLASGAKITANTALIGSVSGWAGSTITNEINALVDSAPGTLDTLNEIAEAINDDANIATTLTNSITANTTLIHSSGNFLLGEINTVSGLLYNDASLSGYFETRVDTNETNIATNVTNIAAKLPAASGGVITAVSGYFETRSDLADTSIDAVSGIAVYASGQAGGGGASNINDLGDVIFGGTNLSYTLLINNGAGSSPQHGTLTGDNQNNIGIGYYALSSITDADTNIALGYFANRFLTTGYNNVSIGASAGEQMTTGFRNIQIGQLAHQYANDGAWNIAIGQEALRGNSDGTSTTENYNNVAIGHQALNKIETGDSNVAIGRSAGSGVTTGSQNIFLGNYAGAETVTTESSQLYVGHGKPGSDGTLIKGDMSNKRLGLGKADIDLSSDPATVQIISSTSTDKGIIVKGASSQSANLQEWQTNAGTVHAHITNNGDFLTSGDITSASGQIFIQGGGSPVTGPTLCFTGSSNRRLGLYEKQSDEQLSFCAAGRNKIIFGTDRLQVNNEAYIGWSSSMVGEAEDTTDTNFKRHSAGIISVHGSALTADRAKLGQILASGLTASGVELVNHVPVSTTNRLYNDGGTLKFNGSAVNTDTNTTYTAGSGLELHGTAFQAAISGANLLATNTPSDNQLASYDAATGKFTWVSAGAGGENNEYSFKTISVAGQDDVVADTTTDTLTFAAGSNVTITTTAGSDTVTIASSDTNTQLSTEEVQDIAGPLVATGGTKTGISITYDDTNGDMDFVVDHDTASNFVANEHIDHTSVTLTAGDGLTGGGDISANRTFTVVGDSGVLVTDKVHANLVDYTVQSTAANSRTTTASRTYAVQVDSSDKLVVNVPWVDNDTNTQLSEEQVEDFVGGMLGGTETGITVTYQDDTGDIDFVVSDTTVAGDSGSTGITPGDTLTIAGGTNVTTAMAGDTLTITATDTNTQLTQEQVEDFVGGMLDGDETFITVTYDDTDGNIDFTVPVKDEDDMTSNSASHLATQQSIKAYVDTEITNLIGGAPGALDTLNELAAAINDDASYASTITTALAGKQAVDAGLTSIAGLTTAADKMIYTTGSDTYAVADLTAAARGLLDDANVAAMRTTLGVDAAGTDNSTNVTLNTSSHDYLSISTQAITLGPIDLTADVTGDLPVSEGGTGASTASAARTNLGVAIGSNVQAHSAILDDIAGLTQAADKLPYFNASTTAATTDLSAFGRSLIDDADAATARTTLGVDAAGTDNSTNVTLVTGSHDYLSISSQAITLGQIDIGDDTNLAGGDGLTLTGDTLSVNVDDSTIETNSDSLRVKDAGITLAKMANLADMKVIGNTSGGSATPAAVSILDEDDMASNSATSLATQQSIKTYVDDDKVPKVPGTTNLQDIGSSTKRFSRIWAARQVNVVLADATYTGFQVKGHASQSANLQSWKNSGATELIAIGPDGGLVLPDNVPSSTTNKLYNDGGTLTFNGSAVGGGGGGGDITGVTLAGDSGTAEDLTANVNLTIAGGNGITTTGSSATMTIALDAALTTVTSAYNASLKLGRDSENLIDFATTDNKIILRANNVDQVSLIDNVFGPEADSDVDLGTSAKRWKDAYVDSLTTTGDVTCGGEVNTAKVSYTDGDDAITIADGGAVTFAKSINQAANAPSAQGGAIDIDCGASNYHEILLNADVTEVDFINATPGQRIVVRFKQHSSHIDLNSAEGWHMGSNDIKVDGSNATLKWAGGVIPTLTESNNAVDVYGFIFESTVTNVMGFIIGQNIS